MTKATTLRHFEPITSKIPQHHDSQAILAVVRDALHLTGYGELRRVQVDCDGDSVTISGRVPTYYLKQLAQHAALEVPGIERIHNELHVC